MILEAVLGGVIGAVLGIVLGILLGFLAQRKRSTELRKHLERIAVAAELDGPKSGS